MIMDTNERRDNRVLPELGCPCCHERGTDRLEWLECEMVRCLRCGMVYDPAQRDVTAN